MYVIDGNARLASPSGKQTDSGWRDQGYIVIRHHLWLSYYRQKLQPWWAIIYHQSDAISRTDLHVCCSLNGFAIDKAEKDLRSKRKQIRLWDMIIRKFRCGKLTIVPTNFPSNEIFIRDFVQRGQIIDLGVTCAICDKFFTMRRYADQSTCIDDEMDTNGDHNIGALRRNSRFTL